MESRFRHLPSVDRLISEERIKQLQDDYPRTLIVELIREQLERERVLLASGQGGATTDEIIEAVRGNLINLVESRLRPVINATGVLLHTNLGRALLSETAITAMNRVSGNYCNLELDLVSNTRSSRHIHCEELLCHLCGAEAAVVVNNNAAAVLLALTALARRKEVIVSRGQSVEIGGGFRIPEVMRQSGAKLVEVGTTNCTYIEDFKEAVSERTAALMRIHSSNFRVTGFTQAVTLEELIELANRCELPVFDDLGSGCLPDTTAFGLASEPLVSQSITLGAGLAFFSGDKLLGGPQAGIIVGRKLLMDRIKRHPLYRAVRIDKVRLAGLIATLTHYVKDEAITRIPIWRMIATPVTELEKRATTWAEAAGSLAQVIDGESTVGGGSLPGSTLPTRLLAIGERGRKKDKDLAGNLAGRLRSEDPPIVGRISGNFLLLDPRSVLPEEDKIIVKSLRDLTANMKLT